MSLDYRDILEQQYEGRRHGNPSYSLRAFARDLALAPSQLSEVMKGTSGLSAAKAVTVAGKLGLGEEMAAIFLDLVESQHARDARLRASAKSRLATRLDKRAYKVIDVDVFALISEWYHLALLELTKVKSFRSDHAWIARALGLSGEAALGAVNRLRRLGLVKVVKERIELVTSRNSTPDDVPSQAIRSFHAQVLAKAKDALLKQDVAEREFGTLMFPVSRAQIPEAKRMIREFQDKFAEAMQASCEKDEVYALSVQFFRLSDCREDST